MCNRVRDAGVEVSRRVSCPGSSGVLGAGIAGRRKKSDGDQNGDQQYNGRQDDFNMDFCSHPGRMAD